MPAWHERRRFCVEFVVIAATALLTLSATPARAADPVIAAAGDIACSSAKASGSGCHQQATSDLLVGAPLRGVLTLGDNQYESGALADYNQFYNASWGRVKAITHPSVGNHEYGTKGASGYFGYFGAAAGAPGQGYYSYDIGAWHLIALNSNCGSSVGCGPGSPQESWLAADLAAHKNACTLAYWHHPLFSSGPHGSLGSARSFWNDLYAAGADVVLNGHDHDYERFAPQNPDGVADPAYGIRAFVSGTGGKSHYNFSAIKPNSEVRNADTFGVLELTLHPASFDWRFVPEAGKTFTDAGTGLCHGSPGESLLALSKASRVRLSGKGFAVFARCATACTLKARAVVKIGRRKIKSRVFKRNLAPEQRVKLRLKFPKRKARAMHAALRRGKRLRAIVTATAAGPTGKPGVAKLKIRLRR